ncbi:hypothetical protein, conserved [Babesia bigemina]|uniref:Uncharacterized protein n=1 Tax=Babesia bigemina TaxID=5866 RepID=A0A061DD04_BABBI|nr:hypothetical protein, conserved [Babesia bigemina]CDR95850.1 hypothetical protein, conserved [Babesia bigemina]|eukprot:XP_012768036.1 hypothetical protein, conserved [Babesia bigemina]
MAAVREYLVYGVDDAHKHLWPVHYHLLKNDFMAAIDAIRRGADPLLTDSRGESALALCYQLFFKTVNRCLNSTVPLGNRKCQQGWSLNKTRYDAIAAPKATYTPPTPKKHKLEAAPELHGVADYESAGKPAMKVDKCVDPPLFTSQIDFVVASHNIEAASSAHTSLFRRAKGLLAVLRTASERDGMLLHSKHELLRAIRDLEYPGLYASLMDHMFLQSASYGLKNLDNTDVWDARCLWRAAASKHAALQSLTTFVSQVAGLLEELCSVFHVDIYSNSPLRGTELYPGHDRRLLLPGLESSTIEMIAHIAFVTNHPLLFDAMVLQEVFQQGGSAFKWSDLLSRLLGEAEHMKPFMEPLMRRSLRKNVENRILFHN